MDTSGIDFGPREVFDIFWLYIIYVNREVPSVGYMKLILYHPDPILTLYQDSFVMVFGMPPCKLGRAISIAEN